MTDGDTAALATSVHDRLLALTVDGWVEWEPQLCSGFALRILDDDDITVKFTLTRLEAPTTIRLAMHPADLAVHEGFSINLDDDRLWNAVVAQRPKPDAVIARAIQALDRKDKAIERRRAVTASASALERATMRRPPIKLPPRDGAPEILVNEILDIDDQVNGSRWTGVVTSVGLDGTISVVPLDDTGRPASRPMVLDNLGLRDVHVAQS